MDKSKTPEQAPVDASSPEQTQREINEVMSELTEIVERKHRLLQRRDHQLRRISLQRSLYQVGDVVQNATQRPHLVTRIEPDSKGGPPAYFGLRLSADGGGISDGEFQLGATVGYRRIGHVTQMKWA